MLADDFDTLFRREEKRMLRVAYLMLRSQQAAEDAVSHGFEQVWSRRRRIDNPGAYLRTCVVNWCTRERRKRRREVLLETHPDEAVDQMVDHTLDALQALPPRQRVVVVLRFYEQMTLPEIADLLGWRLGTVTSRLHRALGRLRKILGPELGLGDG